MDWWGRGRVWGALNFPFQLISRNKKREFINLDSRVANDTI